VRDGSFVEAEEDFKAIRDDGNADEEEVYLSVLKRALRS
jgi:hypothetical protein